MMSRNRGAPYLWDIFGAGEPWLPFLLVTEAGTARTPLALRTDAMNPEQAKYRGLTVQDAGCFVWGWPPVVLLFTNHMVC